jgi:hypothetical protein
LSAGDVEEPHDGSQDPTADPSLATVPKTARKGGRWADRSHGANCGATPASTLRCSQCQVLPGSASVDRYETADRHASLRSGTCSTSMLATSPPLGPAV